MRQYKYLFLISFLFFSIFAHAQRIKPSSRIEKATDSTYILLSDIDGKYQHTKLVAESGISFNISNDTIYISATGGGTSGVSSITGGLGIDPDGSNTGAVTLSFDPTEFGTLSTLDGNEDMWGYSSVVGQPVKYDIQGVFSNVLNDQANGIDFTESGTNQINVDLDLGELSLGTTFDGAFLLLGNYGTSTERTTYFQYLLKNTLTSTDGSVTFTDNSFTLDLSASGGGGMTSFNIQEDGGALEAIGDGETVEFISGSNMNITRSTNDLTFNVTGLDNYSSWTLRADDANTDLITSGETVDIAGSTGVQTTNDLTNLTINLAPDQFPVNSSPPSTDYVWVFDGVGGQERTRIQDLPISGGSGVSSITVGTGLDGGGTGAVSIDFDLSELILSAGYDYNDFLVGTTSTGTESRTNVLDMFDNTLTAGSGISLTNTGTSLQIAATGSGGQLTQEEVQDYVGSMVSGNTEVGITVTYDDAGNEFDFVVTDASTTNEIQDFDIAQLNGTNLELSLTQDPTTHIIDLSSLGGGGGMTSWTARTEDLVTTTVSDGTILDFEAGNGLKTQTSLGDVKVILDGPSLIDLGSITGAYEMWVHSGVITGARSVQNILTDVLTSSDGSVTIGTSGNSVNLTATGSADGDANWDDASVSLSYTNGDMSSTVVSSTYANKRHFIIGSTLTSAAGGNNNIILPTASSTYQYHEIWVMSSDNSGSHNTIISSGSIIKTLADGELVCVKCVNLNGTYFWVAT